MASTTFIMLPFQDSLVSLSSLSFQSLVLYYVLFQELRENSVTMAHLDPSEISSEPLSVATVSKISIITLSFYLPSATAYYAEKSVKGTQKDNENSFIRRFMFGAVICSTLLGGIIVFICAILSGASPFSCVPQTLIASFYCSAITLCPTTVMYSSLSPKEYGFNAVTKIYESSNSPWKSHHFIFFGTIIGTIVSMILLPLDWGAQIQRWPVPMIIGTWFGYSLATIGILYSCIMHACSQATMK